MHGWKIIAGLLRMEWKDLTHKEMINGLYNKINLFFRDKTRQQKGKILLETNYESQKQKRRMEVFFFFLLRKKKYCLSN